MRTEEDISGRGGLGNTVRAIVGIDPLELREGVLPPRVLGLVMEWAELHQAELRENWTTLAAEGSRSTITRSAPPCSQPALAGQEIA